MDAVIISHMHFDHLSVGSLQLLESRMRGRGAQRGMVYLPDSAVPAAELAPFGAWSGMACGSPPRRWITPAFATGSTRGMKDSFTGYVLEHRADRLLGGDTAYDQRDFVATRRRFPPSIGHPHRPHPPARLMKRVHMDPSEAVQAFFDLGAARMLPMHFDTFINSLDAPGEAEAVLRKVMARRGLDERRLPILRIGEQRVLTPR